MYSNAFGISSILVYVIATGLILYSVFNARADAARNTRNPIAFLWLAGIAGTLHAGSLIEDFWNPQGMNFGFMSAVSLAILLVVAILLVSALTKPVEKLGIVVFPIAALIQALKLLLPEQTHLIQEISSGMEVHILSSMLSYSILNIAAIQALFLALQDRQLHRHDSNTLILSLPPMQTMESLLFQLIGTGLILLTISLASGFLFLEDMFVQHLAHKTILSILAWILFSVLLVGRLAFGWRGQTAARWTVGGFVSLMLAYFGSKMVLELILQRT